jgi:predicted transcriptional regulator
MAKEYVVDLDEGEKVELVALTRLDSLSYEAGRLVLKKQSQTLAASEMVYSIRHRCQICLEDGRYYGSVRRFLSTSLSSDLF